MYKKGHGKSSTNSTALLSIHYQWDMSLEWPSHSSHSFALMVQTPSNEFHVIIK